MVEGLTFIPGTVVVVVGRLGDIFGNNMILPPRDSPDFYRVSLKGETTHRLNNARFLKESTLVTA